MARQIGTVLGVAGLVALLSHQLAGDPVPTFRHGTLLIIGLFVAAGVTAAGLLARRADAAATPASAETLAPTDPAEMADAGASTAASSAR